MQPTPSWVGCSPRNFMIGRDGAAIAWVVIHTMDGTREAATARFNDPGQQVSAHYGISYQGDAVLQWVQEADTAYQAGVWAVNLTSIGIEHEDMGQPDQPRPDALYATSAGLVAEVCRRWQVPLQYGSVADNVAGIIAHRDTGAQTACPDSLDVDRIIRLALQVAAGGGGPAGGGGVAARSIVISSEG